MSFWAYSRLFQKFSADIWAFISLRRFCALAMSKKPPQMREFLGRRGNFCRDGVEHGAEDTSKSEKVKTQKPAL